MSIEYLIKNYASLVLDAYVKSIKINALDIEIIDKDNERTHYTKELLEKMLTEAGLSDKLQKGGV